MSRKRLYVLTLLLAIGCQQAAAGDRPVSLATDTSAKAELDKELKIYKSTLLEGSSEQIRIDAATVMLFNENPLARQILLDTLGQPGNSAARVAICKALTQTRATDRRIPNKDDFIQPLLEILASDDTAAAKLAAEATLIYDYEEVQKDLERILTDTLVQSRLNAILALKLRPDVRAAIRLIRLVDDPESSVAKAAEEALDSLGIPVGKDAEARKQDMYRLQREGLAAFLRRRLVRLETEMRNLAAEVSLWRDRYLSELRQRYDAIVDEATKAKFLADHLSSSEPIVKLWALDKVRQDRVGTATKSKLPAELGPILINLVSDQDRRVRLGTANLLSLMGELNSAEKLLEQLKSEQDDEVKTEVFRALGVAVSSASLSPPIKISPEIRSQTLTWAAAFLAEEDPQKAQKGAEVIKKLLEQNGLTPEDASKYLGLLAQRYNQQKNTADGTLRGELLGAMAGLCAPRSVCRDQAAQIYRPLFEGALSDPADLVRQAAVDGLVHIDRTSALSRLRKDLVNDPSPIIRKKLIDLRGEVGGEEDLPWLAEKMGTTGESDPAWQAMLKIFKRAGVTVLTEWIAKLDSDNSPNKVSAEQKISLLETVEQKAVGENRPGVLKDTRARLARLYHASGQFERAAKCLEFLREVAQTAEEKKAVLPELLDAYLRWPNVESVAKLVRNCLLEKDLDPNGAFVYVIDEYLSDPPAGADTGAVLQALLQIDMKNLPSRPMWQALLKRWAARLGEAAGSDRSRRAA
jgi:HEAT repeat protein